MVPKTRRKQIHLVVEDEYDEERLGYWMHMLAGTDIKVNYTTQDTCINSVFFDRGDGAALRVGLRKSKDSSIFLGTLLS